LETPGLGGYAPPKNPCERMAFLRRSRAAVSCHIFMKAVIDGKWYDTETAEEIASWANSNDYRDVDYCSETLYKTKDGDFLLTGEGGSRSIYGKHFGKYSCSGKETRALTREEAYKWCEGNQQPEAIEKHFADMVMDA